MKLFPVIALSAFAFTSILHAEASPRAPRAAFLCAEILSGTPGEDITKDTVAAELAGARARLSAVTDPAPTTGWGRFKSAFAEYNPYLYRGFTVQLDRTIDRNSPYATRHEAYAPYATEGEAFPSNVPASEVKVAPTLEQKQMATAALKRLDEIEREVNAYVPPATPSPELRAALNDIIKSGVSQRRESSASPVEVADGQRALVNVLKARAAQLASTEDQPPSPTFHGELERLGKSPRPTLLISRVIRGREAVLNALAALRAGAEKREAAHPGLVEKPAPHYSEEQIKKLRVGRYVPDLLRTLIYGTGSTVYAIAAGILTYNMYVGPTVRLADVLSAVGFAAVGSVQGVLFKNNWGYLKISGKIFDKEQRRLNQNEARRRHETWISEQASAVAQFDLMRDIVTQPDRYQEPVLLQSLHINLPMVGREWGGSPVRLTTGLIEHYERNPSDSDTLVNRSATVDLLLDTDEASTPTLRVFVRENKIDPTLAGYGVWPSEHPFYPM